MEGMKGREQKRGNRMEEKGKAAEGNIRLQERLSRNDGEGK